MKSLKIKLFVCLTVMMLALSLSCKHYLDKTPPGSLNTVILASKAGVDGLLIGAYSLLDGVWRGAEHADVPGVHGAARLAAGDESPSV